MPTTDKKAAGSSPTTTSRKRKMEPGEQKYYAVRVGHKPGVYTAWPICQQQISGFKGAQFKSFLSYEDASAFAAGRDPPSAEGNPQRFYGVAVGRKPGVYTEWTKAQEAIVGSKGPKYRKFDTRAEAEAFVRAHANPAKAPMTGGKADSEEDDDNYEDGGISDEDEGPPAKKNKVKETPSGQPRPALGGKNIAVVYTDGSSRGNGQVGCRAGVGVFFGPQDPRNISERLVGDPQTNQRAELTAVLRALQIIGDNQSVEIRTDSKYSIKCSTEWYVNWGKNGWMTKQGPVKNRDLVEKIRERINARDRNNVLTQFIWVKGHATDMGNRAADLLAVQGADL